MSDPSWADLEAWAEQGVSEEELAVLSAALEDGAPALLEALRSIVARDPHPGPLPAALALLFWRLHGVPFNDSLHHQRLLEELFSHLPPGPAALEIVLDPTDLELVAEVSSLSPTSSGIRSQVATCSDVLLSAGLALHLPLEGGQADDASAVAWLSHRLQGEPPSSCHLSPGRHERFSLLLGERSTLWVLEPSPRPVPLYASESLSDDEVHLVNESGYLEMYIPPATLRESPSLCEVYSLHRSAGLAPGAALSATLS